MKCFVCDGWVDCDNFIEDQEKVTDKREYVYLQATACEENEYENQVAHDYCWNRALIALIKNQVGDT